MFRADVTCAKKTGSEIAAAIMEVIRRFHGVQSVSEFSVKYGHKFAPVRFICCLEIVCKDKMLGKC